MAKQTTFYIDSYLPPEMFKEQVREGNWPIGSVYRETTRRTEPRFVKNFCSPVDTLYTYCVEAELVLPDMRRFLGFAGVGPVFKLVEQ